MKIVGTAPRPHPAKFLPSDVETITGIATSTLRSWHKRGLLHAALVKEWGLNDAGWKRYPLHAVAHLLILRELSDQGIGPKQVEAWASSMASHVVRHILADPRAFRTFGEYEVLRRGPTGCISRSPEVSARRFCVLLPAPVGYRFTDDLTQFFARLEDQPVVTVLDLESMANIILDRAKPPLATVVQDIAEERGDQIIVHQDVAYIPHSGNRPEGESIG